jgi:hypothetical protein
MTHTDPPDDDLIAYDPTFALHRAHRALAAAIREERYYEPDHLRRAQACALVSIADSLALLARPEAAVVPFDAPR